jgi:hypothetical protein
MSAASYLTEARELQDTGVADSEELVGNAGTDPADPTGNVTVVGLPDGSVPVRQ